MSGVFHVFWYPNIFPLVSFPSLWRTFFSNFLRRLYWSMVLPFFCLKEFISPSMLTYIFLVHLCLSTSLFLDTESTTDNFFLSVLENYCATSRVFSLLSGKIPVLISEDAPLQWCLISPCLLSKFFLTQKMICPDILFFGLFFSVFHIK